MQCANTSGAVDAHELNVEVIRNGVHLLEHAIEASCSDSRRPVRRSIQSVARRLSGDRTSTAQNLRQHFVTKLRFEQVSTECSDHA